MPTYTRELRDVLGFNRAQDAIDDIESMRKIGLSDYPIFDENYRDVLNGQIVRKFYHREIGFETTSMFAFYMDQRLREIMPRYNELYLSTRLKFDPIATIDISTFSESSSERTSASASETDSENSSKSRAVNSTFPQQMLANNGDYADAAQDSTSASSGKSKSDGTGEENGSGKSQSKTKGFQGSAATLLQAYRQTLINVDQLVLIELSDLFMSIWSTDDSAFSSQRGWPYYG